MATGKRYYWIKLKETFMTSDTVDFLMGQPNGAQYVVLYQMLCLMTANTNGKLSKQIGDVIIPYDPEKIHRDTKWFSVDTVRVALGLYAKLGLVYQDQDGALVLTNHSELVGSETDFSAQKRRQRSIQREISSGDCGQCPQQRPQDVHENVHTDIRDKEIDIRYKEISPNGDTKKGAKAPSPTLKSTRFHPPDVAEVEAYFAEKGGTNAQAERFFAYYESNGWRVGKNPMKKWKAAASGWISRDREQHPDKPAQSSQPKTAAQAYADIFRGVK